MSNGSPKLRDVIAIHPLLITVLVLSVVAYGVSALAPGSTPPSVLLAEAAGGQNSEALDALCSPGRNYSCKCGEVVNGKQCGEGCQVESGDVEGHCTGSKDAQTDKVLNADGQWVSPSVFDTGTAGLNTYDVPFQSAQVSADTLPSLSGQNVSPSSLVQNVSDSPNGLPLVQQGPFMLPSEADQNLASPLQNGSTQYTVENPILDDQGNVVGGTPVIIQNGDNMAYPTNQSASMSSFYGSNGVLSGPVPDDMIPEKTNYFSVDPTTGQLLYASEPVSLDESGIVPQPQNSSQYANNPTFSENTGSVNAFTATPAPTSWWDQIMSYLHY